MKERPGLTKEEFERLLSWLDPDRERAGKKYEEIRFSLIRIFTWNVCADAEDMADETINRVARRLPAIKGTYVGDRALYFYGVGKNLLRERRRQAGRIVPLTPQVSPAAPADPPEPDEARDDPELTLQCMRACIALLKPNDRELFLRYYSGEKKAKYYRQELARQLGKTHNALRVKVKRLRTRLDECIRKCVADAGGCETN
jgi:RNA polymerase sigma factor (sigma-70 family)